MQTAEPFPYQDLTPPFDWMTYREPEDHLDAVVEKLFSLIRLDKTATVAGITFKDATTLDRLRARGHSNVWSLDLRKDLGATHPNANIESIQALLTPAKAAEIKSRRGPVDLLIVRHILEHAESPRRLMEALSELLTPNGYIVIEIPDCTKNLKAQDYSMVWEEHTLYLTPATAPQLLGSGFTNLGLEVHPFPFEDVIVLYAQKKDGASTATPTPQKPDDSTAALSRQYAASFDGWTQRYRKVLTDLTRDGRRVAAYGAGHLTCAFLHFHGLSEFFAFVVDDTPHKQGLFLPKSGLPIVARDALTADKISACFFGLTPQIEDRVIANNAEFVQDGGRFFSMFVDSPRSIRTLTS